MFNSNAKLDGEKENRNDINHPELEFNKIN